MSFCEIHFAEGLGYSLMDNSKYLSQGRVSDNKKEVFNPICLGRLKMISQIVS